VRERELAGGPAEQARQAGAAGATASGASEEAEGSAGAIRSTATAAEEHGRSYHRATGAARLAEEDRLREQPPSKDGPGPERGEFRISHQSQREASGAAGGCHQQ